MTSAFSSHKYLSRIGLGNTEIKPDLFCLKLLQRQHLLTVPFENLDIHWNRPIVLDTDAFYRKIVGEERGGFCYELNGLFNVLLREIGFETKLISARVCIEEGGLGPEYDHMAIIAKAGGEEYLADVGFGKFTAEPLKLGLDDEEKQIDVTGVYQIRSYGGSLMSIVEKEEKIHVVYLPLDKNNTPQKRTEPPSEWSGEYVFTSKSHRLTDFAGMCEFHQTSPNSHFTKGIVCSLMTETGRKTLTNNEFTVTETDGMKHGRFLKRKEEFNECLKHEFNIDPKIEA